MSMAMIRTLACSTAAVIGMLAAAPAAAQSQTAWHMTGILYEAPYAETLGCGFEGVGAQLQARLTRGGALRYGLGAGIRAAGVLACSGSDIGIIDDANSRSVERDDEFALRPIIAGVVAYPVRSSRFIITPGARLAAVAGWVGDDLFIVPEAGIEVSVGSGALAVTAAAGRMHAPVRYMDLSDGSTETASIWRTLLELGLQLRP